MSETTNGRNDGPLTITSSGLADGTRLSVSGEIDVSTREYLAQELRSAAGPNVEIDMGGVTFMDSSGLRTLIEALPGAADDDASLVITDASESVQRLLELTGLLATFGLPANSE